MNFKITDMNLEQSFKEAKRLGELRTKNQTKALNAFYERKRFNEMQKDKNRRK